MKKIAITMGDPLGIGPEILYYALKEVIDQIGFTPVILGNPHIYQKLNIEPEKWFLDLFEEGFDQNIESHLGQSCLEGGKESFSYLKKSVELAKSSKISGIINAPVSKEAISLSQKGFLGHTVYYQEHLSKDQAVMTFYGEQFSMILLSHHIPIKDVSDFLFSQNIEETARVALDGFRHLYGRTPVVKVLGVNPHAGEAGLISYGEDDRLQKMIDTLNVEGFNLSGPYPADTLFAGENLGDTDVIISAYHDQGLIPFKLLHFQKGVSITWGLDLPRMTVDHGTAYDLAGKSKAKYQSMIEVIMCMDDYIS
ncbi:4-hydroxythreonine-4-phosphate dehydrogenase PdxA [bacterium]|nr:4-hydroxythreonine-4-phosphate dehydrogenase PdxA [bacterium]